ncbi:M14 family zinc carboxypeptidase [Kangiella sp. TOML190]|uniref:M14 family zinc carboxypeptidase n=1 Tax=Kangiella sp. TOML190 TaxID=2931351 RepID=UPI00203D7DD3|nr:M14 family zinc carboxypeptidase [Kangiella sp. TOML190]
MGKIIQKSLLALSTALLPFAASSEVLTYTESTNSNTEMAIGYPVPIPVDSMMAINGFRSYDSLKAHHQGLALLHPEMSSIKVGDTANGREILAYQFGDTNNTDADGLTEPAFLVNGTIHAREWQSPEVVTELIEQLMERKADQGMVQYLLENTNIVILPVLNIDGFLQTQRNPVNVTNSPGTNANSSANDKFAQPRDGRMRRKNMPNVDEVLATENDRLNGVDLNRNSKHFFGVQPGNSDPLSLLYGGTNPFSEPETQALLEAAKLAPESRLRFYQDTHSFSRVLFVPQPNNSRLNAITQNIATRFQNTTISQGANYFPVIDQVGSGIATTADYFAYEYFIPTWTLEIEPPQGFQGEPNGGAFYGGTGASHSGFIAPDSAIARIRDQLAPAQLLMFYHQAGPAYVKSVRIADENDQLVYAADWQTNGNSRSLSVSTDQVLSGGQQYRLWVQFSKPMRWRSGGNIVQYPGQSVTLAPTISLTGTANGSSFNRAIATSNNDWQNQAGGELQGFATYLDDAILVNFTVPSNVNVSSASGNTNFDLNLNVQDFAGLSLDANPASPVDWANGAWTGYQNTNGASGDIGGTDASYSIKVANSSLTLSNSANDSGSGGGGGAISWWLLLALTGFRLARKKN